MPRTEKRPRSAASVKVRWRAPSLWYFLIGEVKKKRSVRTIRLSCRKGAPVSFLPPRCSCSCSRPWTEEHRWRSAALSSALCRGGGGVCVGCAGGAALMSKEGGVGGVWNQVSSCGYYNTHNTHPFFLMNNIFWYLTCENGQLTHDIILFSHAKIVTRSTEKVEFTRESSIKHTKMHFKVL